MYVCVCRDMVYELCFSNISIVERSKEHFEGCNAFIVSAYGTNCFFHSYAN